MLRGEQRFALLRRRLGPVRAHDVRHARHDGELAALAFRRGQPIREPPARGLLLDHGQRLQQRRGGHAPVLDALGGRRFEQPAQAIVFCRTKRGTDKVFRKLSKQLEGVDAIHGDMVQRARDRVMKRFRAGEIKILIATDVVGRGIDVTSISHIINYDIPQSSDDYVHRVGRTGRMGREGVAFTFVTTEEGGEH